MLSAAGEIISQSLSDGFGKVIVETAPSIMGFIYMRSEYNAKGQPVKQYRVASFTSEDGNTVVECAYDFMGRRATKKVTTNGRVTLHQRYIYRGYLQIAAHDLTRSAIPAMWYILWDPTQPTATRPLAIQKDGVWYTYGWDLTKNICEVYGSSGYIRTLYTYTPYGAVTAEGDVTQPIQWSSEFRDIELGLVYYNYRYYNPLNGRWINRDIIDVFGGNNLYNHVDNSTMYLFDYLGLQIDWHHLVPQEIEKDLANDINIHSKEYGYHIDSKYHTGKGGVHPEGWNQEWKAWAKKQTKPIPKACVDKQLRKMLSDPKFSMLKTYGKKAINSYGEWRRMEKTLKDRFVKKFEREVEEKIAKKAVKKGVASVPVAGWIFTVGFMVADIARGEGVVDSVMSNIPYVGVAYDAYSITADIIEAETAFEDQFFQNADPL